MVIIGSSGIGPSEPDFTQIAIGVSNKVDGFRVSETLFSQAVSQWRGAGVKFFHINMNYTGSGSADAQRAVALVRANPFITSIGIVNEPNCSNGRSGFPLSTSTLASYVAAFATVWAAAGITGTVFAPFELCGSGGSSVQSYLQQVWNALNATARAAIGAVCFHFYPNQPINWTTVSQDLDAMQAITGKPVILGEFNVFNGSNVYSGSDPTGDIQHMSQLLAQKPYIVALYYYGWNPGSGQFPIEVVGTGLNSYGQAYVAGASSGPSGCPAGDLPENPDGTCPQGYVVDTANPGCCKPATSTCPPGDVPANPDGSCPSGYYADPNAPGCCHPTPPHTDLSGTIIIGGVIATSVIAGLFLLI